MANESLLDMPIPTVTVCQATQAPNTHTDRKNQCLLVEKSVLNFKNYVMNIYRKSQRIFIKWNLQWYKIFTPSQLWKFTEIWISPNVLWQCTIETTKMAF